MQCVSHPLSLSSPSREYLDLVTKAKSSSTSKLLTNTKRPTNDCSFDYRQWNVVKKNKFGLRQERFLANNPIKSRNR